MTIRAGIQYEWLAPVARAELARAGQESDIRYSPEFQDADQLRAALLKGDIDVALAVHARLPVAPSGGWVIGALSARSTAADLLLIRPEAVEARPFRLRSGASLGVSTAAQKFQMLDFRPDVQCFNLGMPFDAALDKLMSGGCDAILVAAAEAAQCSLDGGVVAIEISPKEMVPAAGQGVWAWLALESDLPMRRLLQKIHHPEVSACTNVERKLVQLLSAGSDYPVGVYCERDKLGNFHVFGAAMTQDAVRRVRLSQNAALGLAERLLEALQS